eukprot:CAMPEP_0114987622 /NCGR_PEP_ID=MMETSP0216-20121206/9115_1 /TAXON_ID=223996 /ORGANISM="Protocruzia adherens, Strain Boccale" /LENGTH=84 /DNA_ID=CAMNT_0002350251 /DNA_START=512 /DNA_END=765 /DNA_ORIENTATION=+
MKIKLEEVAARLQQAEMHEVHEDFASQRSPTGKKSASRNLLEAQPVQSYDDDDVKMSPTRPQLQILAKATWEKLDETLDTLLIH